MNNEKDKIGVNNDLPPMGTMIDNTSENKLNLPPISSFTNFGDSSISSDNNVSSNNANASIFNLMDQFDQVGSNNTNQSINQSLSSQSINSNNVQDNLVLNGQPSINDNSFINQTVNNVSPVVEPQVQLQNLNATGMNKTVNGINSVEEISPQQTLFNMGSQTQQPVNNIVNGQKQEQAPIFNMNSGTNPVVNDIQAQSSILNNNGISQTVNGINSVQETQAQSPLFNMGSQIQQPVNNMVNDLQQEQAPIFNMNSGNNPAVNDIQAQSSTLNNNGISQTVNGINSVQETQAQFPVFNMDNNSINSLGNQSVPNMNNIQNIATEPMNNESNDLLTHDPIINNQEEELITKFSMDESLDNNVNSQNQKIVEPPISNNNPNLNNIDNKKVNNKKEKKSKSKKMLFIILLVITILLVGVAFIICYFKFIKTDKLVCSLQDYSNEQFLVEESMVMNFKGSNLVNANLKRNLTFVESYMDSKETYLEELRNQFGGLGFDVSYSENDTGFEINMNFTKQELENWYGSTLKNSSKNNMLKEMKDVGYTCK